MATGKNTTSSLPPTIVRCAVHSQPAGEIALDRTWLGSNSVSS